MGNSHNWKNWAKSHVSIVQVRLWYVVVVVEAGRIEQEQSSLQQRKEERGFRVMSGCHGMAHVPPPTHSLSGEGEENGVDLLSASPDVGRQVRSW